MDRVVVSGKVVDRADLAQALGAALLAGSELEVRVSGAERSATDLAREAAQQGAERVVAVGGDGTLHEVVRGLMSVPAAARPVMGIVPCGTANDFAAQFDASTQALDEWLRFALRGESQLVDVGMAGGTPFLNMATVGPPAEVSEETGPELKQAVGKIAYTVQALAQAGQTTPVSLTARGPGLEFQGEVAALFVCNGRQAGGGFVLAPDAQLDDGLFEVLIVPRMGALGAAVVAGGAMLGGVDLDGRIERHRVPWLELLGLKPLPISLDGEVSWHESMRFEVAREALRLAVPPPKVRTTQDVIAL
jgi:lipid kinase YegS